MHLYNTTSKHAIRRQLVLTCILTAVGAGQVNLTQAQSAWATTRTHTHVVRDATFVQYLAPNETVSILVALKLRNRAQLDKLVEGLVAPDSPQFRHWLTHEDLANEFAPTSQQATKVADHLANAGFTKIEILPNNLLVRAEGTADAARRAFSTELARFRRKGREGIANTSDVQVPNGLADTVEAVLGLQTLDQAHVVTVVTHNPVQFPQIYNAASLPPASHTVVGVITEGDMTQTIADLHQFESQNSLPTINPTVVNVGGTSSDTSGTMEWNLDTQDIQGMAGGQLAGMILYTAASLTDAALTATFNRVVADNSAKVINVSLGICETTADNDGSMAADDSIFEMAIAQGQTFSVASGDWGSKECGSGQNGVSFGTVAGQSYPASSPFVIAVGGTTLSTNSDGSYAGETAWTFSGGGPSLYEAKPSWQGGVVPGTTRGVPDLAFDADPNSGALLVVNGSQASNGGTSLASPLFVGAWARLESAHNNGLGFPAASFYRSGATSSTLIFHDVTSGSNGDYSAGVGWDYVTGFGSLNVAGLNARLSTEAVISIINFALQ
jgi:pseudomonalisin